MNIVSLPFHFLVLVEFQDLLNFDDPLNVDAAEHYERDKVSSNMFPLFTTVTLIVTFFRLEFLLLV